MERFAEPTKTEERVAEPFAFVIAAFPKRIWEQPGDEMIFDTFSCETASVLAANHEATRVGVACGKSVKTVGFVVLV